MPPLHGRHLSAYLKGEQQQHATSTDQKNYMQGSCGLQSEDLFNVLMTLRQNIASPGLKLFSSDESKLTANTMRGALALGAPTHDTRNCGHQLTPVNVKKPH